MSSKPKNCTRVKVIGCGFGRTGTSSLKDALEILYPEGKCYHMTEIINAKDSRLHTAFWTRSVDPAQNDTFDFEEVFAGENYVATCDFPSCMLWRQQLEQYPDAKVILTYRDPEKWFASCVQTIFKMSPDSPYTNFAIRTAIDVFGLPAAGLGPMIRKLIGETAFKGDWSKENVIACYKAWVEDVKSNCPPDKLLVFEVSEGWDPLCSFLGKSVPIVPFPNVNDTAAFQSHVNGATIGGYVLGSIMLGIPFIFTPSQSPGTVALHVEAQEETKKAEAAKK